MKNNKKLINITIAATLVIAIIVGLYMVIDNNKNDAVIAKVNGHKIYKSELNTRLQEMFPNVGKAELEKEVLPKEVIEILVKDIYTQKELDKKAKKSAAAKDEKVKRAIEDFSNKTIRKAYLDSIVNDKVTEATVKDKYAELVSNINGKKEINVKHIMVKTEQEAKNAQNLLKSGVPFETLAKNTSVDTASAKNGGDLGYVLEDSLPTEFRPVLANLKKGAYSGPIKTSFGWHIIKLQDSRDAKAAPFENVKEAIAEQMKRDEIKKVVTDISGKLKVEIVEDKTKKAEPKTKPASTNDERAQAAPAETQAAPAAENIAK